MAGEFFATCGEVFIHVEARAGGRQQHEISRGGDIRRTSNGFRHIAIAIHGYDIYQGRSDFISILTEQNHGFDKLLNGLLQRRKVHAFAITTRNQNESL